MTLQTDHVSEMVQGAVESGARKLGRSEAETLQAIRGGDCSICESVRYGLANRIAEYLGSVDPTVKAIYLYEPEYATEMDVAAPDRPNLTPGINMIVWANRKSAALFSVVASLNSALADEAKRLACPKANALCWTLDTQIVDDEQVRERSGFGALIHSIYVRPIEIWCR